MSPEPLGHPFPNAGYTTREEWLDFVMAAQPVKPDMPTSHERDAMSEVERRRLDRQRCAYHLELGESIIFDTPTTRRIAGELLEVVEANRSARGARRAYAINGEPMLGKSTFLGTFGKRYELSVRRAYPSGRTSAGDDFVPVVYSTLGAEASTKGVNRFIADFYGLPTTGVTDELTLRVQRAARRCGTTLIMIDDIHHLDTRYSKRALVVDHFKMLLNTVPATFVFAGIDADRGALLGGKSGPSSRAVRKRTTVATLEAYSIKNRGARARWCDLLDGVASRLLLFNMETTDLSTRRHPESGEPMFQYLYERTGGEIGTLVDLVRRAANRAIKDGSERITRDLLEGMKSP